jgi:predicted DNA-binding transcriptional regulator AlpA
MTDTDLLTPQEYAKFRRCSVRTLDRERAERRGPPFVRLGARVLYRRSDIDRHIEASLRGGQSEAEP